MSTTPTIKGNNTILWGSGGLRSSGLIARGRKQRTADKAVVLDNNGYVVTVIYFNHRHETEFEAVVETALPEIAIGDAIEVGGVASCLVDDIEVMWENNRERKYRVTATAYDGVVIT